MSYANGTPFLNLPQTVGTDHRDWFDTNEAFLELDTKMKTLWDGASSTADILEQLQETVSDLDTDLAALTTTVNGHTTTLQTVNESLVLINSALTALNTDVHTKFDSAGIADPYDPNYGTYRVDDVVTYNGQRYKCTTAVTAAEPFDADKWFAEDVQTIINQINTDLSDVDARVEYLERNNLGTATPLIGYTSPSTQYTIPNDGYIMVASHYSTQALERATINNVLTIDAKATSTASMFNAIFVKKGMTVYETRATVGGANDSMLYCPLNANT